MGSLACLFRFGGFSKGLIACFYLFSLLAALDTYFPRLLADGDCNFRERLLRVVISAVLPLVKGFSAGFGMIGTKKAFLRVGSQKAKGLAPQL